MPITTTTRLCLAAWLGLFGWTACAADGQVLIEGRCSADSEIAVGLCDKASEFLGGTAALPRLDDAVIMTSRELVALIIPVTERAL